ncbi:MAG TPA: hypothetical protein VN442_23185 [Bryobacteraceae bacterium]|nr:hypothetical protein [Bryobacteraceae bacterium]
MTHPSDATLALYAGQDLGFLARWRTERHLAACDRCRQEVETYSDLRADLPELMDFPDTGWGRLAAEMKANIRLGLAAGECVGSLQPEEPRRVPLFSTRALVACASIIALLSAGVLLERPIPQPKAGEGITLEATANGIQLKGGGQSLSLLHGGASPNANAVTFSVSAQGSMRARYVDSDTGYVTINNVYAQ